MSQAIKIFISYSRKDKAYKEELVEFLAPMRRKGIIESWNDKDIIAGEQWEDELLEQLAAAHIVIFLISSSFLNSDYINRVEINGAIERHKNRELVIIPVLVRSSDFLTSDLSSFQSLPSDLKPISTWNDSDSAWLNVTEGLKKVIQSIQKRNDKKAESTTKQATPNSPSPAPQSVLEQAQKEIAKGKTQKAIDLLSDYTREKRIDDEYNNLIILSGRLSSIKREQQLGTRSRNEIDIARNQINAALLSIISELEDET